MKSLFDPAAWLWFGLLLACLLDAAALWRHRPRARPHPRGAHRGKPRPAGAHHPRPAPEPHARRLRWRRLAVCASLALALWLLEVTAAPTRLLAGLEARFPPLPPASGPFDAVVVLGGGWSQAAPPRAGLEANESFDRLLHGVELARDGAPGGRALLVLGGAGTGRDGRRWPVTDGEAAQRWLARLGVVPPERVVPLPPSRNTREEARHAAALARTRGLRRIALVTSAWHMPRALDTFAAAGVPATPGPCDFPAHAALESRRRDGPRLLPGLGTLQHLHLWLTETAGRTATTRPARRTPTATTGTAQSSANRCAPGAPPPPLRWPGRSHPAASSGSAGRRQHEIVCPGPRSAPCVPPCPTRSAARAASASTSAAPA